MDRAVRGRAEIVGLEGYGLKVVERVPIEVVPGNENARYLATKRDKMGHILHHNGLDLEADPQAEAIGEAPSSRADGIASRRARTVV